VSAIAPTDLAILIDDGSSPPIVDVRTPAEFAAGHVPGAINLPLTDLAVRTIDVGNMAGATVVVYCGHGPRAWMASLALRRRGIKQIVYLRGHWAAWQRAGLRLEPGAERR
jgi:rhodanese-related sulfurtransferase